jgi:hypothetical protein
VKRLAQIAAAAVALHAAVASAAPDTLETSLHMSGGAQYAVRLSQSPVGSATSRVESFGYWGREGATPSKCVSSVAITRNGKAVDLPGKMYVDLCNANTLQASESRGMFVLKVRGGDAGDSFEAEYRFRGVYLYERWVRHGEFPEEAYEHTKFRYNTSDR